jgi:hypothetical protein
MPANQKLEIKRPPVRVGGFFCEGMEYFFYLWLQRLLPDMVFILFINKKNKTTWN